MEMKQLIRQEMLPAELTGMLLSAHLIIFWLSQDSNVTPPVCLASFAAAGSRNPTHPTGLTSWKVASLYLVPIPFAYSPLISGSWPERLEVFLTAGLHAWPDCCVASGSLDHASGSAEPAAQCFSADVDASSDLLPCSRCATAHYTVYHSERVMSWPLHRTI